MKSFIRHLKALDWILIVFALLLVAMGLLSIYSSSLGRGDFSDFKKQLIFFAIGFFLMLALSFFDWRALKNNPFLILSLYVVSIISLVGLFFFAPEIRGIRKWYRIGPVSIDPIEITKLILIIVLAKYFSNRHIEMYKVSHILLSGFYVLIPALLAFFQPDMGQVIILILLWLGILVVSGISFKRFLVLLFCFLLIFILAWNFGLKPYQKERILSFIFPQLSDPLKSGWNKLQVQIAIGSGGIFGKGLGKGSQTQYGFLPEPKTDFIFAAIAEEFGLIGVSIILLSFSLLIWRIMKIALTAETNFPRLFATGFTILLVSQTFIHMGMNLGILPIIGIPLPLVSYGGSNLIATFIGLGILQNIKVSG